MRGLILEKIVFGREIFIYLPPGYNTNDEKYSIIYAQDGDKFRGIINNIVDYMEEEFLNGVFEEHIIVGITPIDRLCEYTPWFSKALNEKFHDFDGKADDYLDFLLNKLQVYMENEFRVSKNKKDRKIIGYSLGALVSLYSIYKNKNYGKIASICASQWYENWLEFISGEEIINDDLKLLMIAGKREGHNKVTIHKDAPKFSKQAYEIFRRRLGEENVKIIWDDYDHHENALNRYKIALEFMLKKE